jgi:hypothetical protein
MAGNSLNEHGKWKTGVTVANEDLLAAIAAFHEGTPIRITTTGADTLRVTLVDFDGVNVVLHVS